MFHVGPSGAECAGLANAAQPPPPQQILPLVFNPAFGRSSPMPAAFGAVPQQGPQQQQQQQQLMEPGGHGGHGGHTHAIQLQTSLEMGPVVCPALCEIRSQLQELTRSVESCQNEVRAGSGRRDAESRT